MIALDRRVTLRRRFDTGELDEQYDPIYRTTDTPIWAGLEEAGQDFEVTERGGVVTTEEAYIVRWDPVLAEGVGEFSIVTASGVVLRVDKVREHGGRRRFLRLTTGART